MNNSTGHHIEVAYPTWGLLLLWTVVLIMSSLTIIGNLLVLISYYVERSIRQQTSNYFLASLAVSDLIIGIEGFPIFSIYVTYGEKWVIGRITCELWLCIDYTVCLVSILTVLLITVDRYCSVCYPALYRLWLNLRKVQFFIILSWFLPTGLFFTTILGWELFTGEKSRVESHLTCEVPFLRNAYVNMALYLTYYWAVLIAIIVLYHGIHKAAAALENRGKVRDRQNIFISTQLNMAQMGAFLGGGSQRAKTHPAPTPTPVEEECPPLPNQTTPNMNIHEPTPTHSHNTASPRRTSRNSSPFSSAERLKISSSIDSQDRLCIPQNNKSNNLQYGTFVKSETLVELSPRRRSMKTEVNLWRTRSQNVPAKNKLVMQNQLSSNPLINRALHAVNSIGSKISMFYREGSEFTLADAFGEASLSSMTKPAAYAASQGWSTNGSTNTHCSLFEDLDQLRPDRCEFMDLEGELEFQPLLSSSQPRSNRMYINNYNDLHQNKHARSAADIDYQRNRLNDNQDNHSVSKSSSKNRSLYRSLDDLDFDMDEEQESVQEEPNGPTPLPKDVAGNELKRKNSAESEESAGTMQKEVTTEVQISTTDNDTLHVESIPFDSSPAPARIHGQGGHVPNTSAATNSNRIPDIPEMEYASDDDVNDLNSNEIHDDADDDLEQDLLDEQPEDSILEHDQDADDEKNVSNSKNFQESQPQGRGKLETPLHNNDEDLPSKNIVDKRVGPPTSVSGFLAVNREDNNNKGGGGTIKGGSGNIKGGGGEIKGGGKSGGGAHKPLIRHASSREEGEGEEDDDNLSKIEDLENFETPDPKGGFSAVIKFMKDRKMKQTRAERRAKKAFRTITIIVGAFAVLWSPYYIVATVYGFCPDCVPSWVFITSYYMCYINSLMNPICYAMANLNFRRCFLRLLRGDFQRK